MKAEVFENGEAGFRRLLKEIQPEKSMAILD
jgi:hypothetical protein